MNSVDVIKVEFIVFVFDIVEDKSNSIGRTSNDLAHHEIGITDHDFLKF